MQTNSSTENDFFRKRTTTSIAFLVAVLLFLLPFVEIRCNNTPVAQNTGLGLAMGSDFKASDELTSMGRSLGGESNGADKSNKDNEGKFYLAALVALLLGITGVVITYMNKASGNIPVVLGVIAALALLILLIQVKSDISQKSEITEQPNQFQDSVRFTASFTPWFYLSLVCFLAAAFLGYKRNQLLNNNEIVPPDAPQLDLKNPGDQSDFPKSASESEIG